VSLDDDDTGSVPKRASFETRFGSFGSTASLEAGSAEPYYADGQNQQLRTIVLYLKGDPVD